ncbi:MAG: hypothetical protein LWW94_03810 [Candidatus Desulfofervidaceae bacterium]|nr:hypothetical protein [Candidatus Desulfofervidaceae bacterium]
MRKLLLVGLACLFVFTVSGQGYTQPLQVYGSLYSTVINFSDSSIKDDGWGITGYASIKDGQYNSLELGVSQLHLDYKSEPDLDQTDFTIAYTNTDQLISHHAFRLGFHYIISDDNVTDNGKIFFGKVTYFIPYEWNVGLEFDYSLYDNTSTDLHVYQFLPHAGFYLNHLIPTGTLYTESKFYYIHKDKNLGLSKDNFFSFEQSLNYYYRAFDAKAHAWVGEQIYAVKNAGFVVYNLADKYKGGLGIEVGYTFKNGLRLAFNLTNDWLKHVGYSDTVKQTVFTITVGTNF